MAVHTNSQQVQLKSVSTSNAVIVTNTLPATVQTLSSNGLIHAILPSTTVKGDASKQVQLRVVSTPQTGSSNKLNQMQPPVVRLIKASNRMPITNANIISVKAPISSPSKGIQPALFLPTNQKAKLKVGDTITIPKSSFVQAEKSSTNSSVAIQKTGVLSTPPKIIRVAESSTTQNPVFLNRTTPVNSPVTLVQTTTPTDSAPSHHQQVASPARLTTISPVWSPSPMRYKRPSAFSDATQASETKRRRTPNSEKGSKGLRHFAMLVCEKVKQKGTTTYNEVADELVAEYSDSHPNMSEQQYDQKNIRRRVYDALNVLMAMNIIYKDKKDINWIGFPTNSAQELMSLQDEKKKRELRIEQKTVQLQELILQQIAFMNLVQRNKRIQETQGPPPENSFIQLPFIIVNTSKKTVIDCSISNDKYEYMFNFDNTFEIHDDIEVLKRMGMAYGLESGRCNSDDLRTAQSLLPPALKPYLEEMAGSHRVSTSGDDKAATNFALPPSDQHINQKLNSGTEKVNNDPESLELGSCFSMEQVLDPDDEEVAMVTDRRQLNGASGGIVMGLTPSSRSSSTGFHSAIYSLTPMSSGGSESRGSTPFESFES